MLLAGFPGSSADKESTCNAGNPSLIPGLGKHPREWIGYPLLYSWVFLVAQMVKNSSAMWETWVWSCGFEPGFSRENPLEEGMATHSSILAWRIPWIEDPGGLQSMWSQRAGQDWATRTFMQTSRSDYSSLVPQFTIFLLLKNITIFIKQIKTNTQTKAVFPSLLRFCFVYILFWQSISPFVEHPG